MSTCHICFEKFKFNDNIARCCICHSIIHIECWSKWRNSNDNNVIPCTICKQYGTLHTDTYDIRYYFNRLSKFSKKQLGKLSCRR